MLVFRTCEKYALLAYHGLSYAVVCSPRGETAHASTRTAPGIVGVGFRVGLGAGFGGGGGFGCAVGGRVAQTTSPWWYSRPRPGGMARRHRGRPEGRAGEVYQAHTTDDESHPSLFSQSQGVLSCVSPGALTGLRWQGGSRALT